jgi:hypothetical protein
MFNSNDEVTRLLRLTISLCKGLDDLQSTGPDRDRRRVNSLSLHDVSIVSGEGVKQMINNIGYKASRKLL